MAVFKTRLRASVPVAVMFGLQSEKTRIVDYGPRIGWATVCHNNNNNNNNHKILLVRRYTIKSGHRAV